MLQKSTLTENWGTTKTFGPPADAAGMKYVVYKQPLSLDRFFIHEVSNSTVQYVYRTKT